MIKPKLDPSGGYTIATGGQAVVKISQLEILRMAERSILSLPEEIRRAMGTNIFSAALSALDVPQEVLASIDTAMGHEQDQTKFDWDPDPKANELMLWVSKYVNVLSPENEFELEEFSSLAIHDFKTIILVLETHGFIAEVNGTTIKITLPGTANAEREREKRAGKE